MIVLMIYTGEMRHKSVITTFKLDFDLEERYAIHTAIYMHKVCSTFPNHNKSLFVIEPSLKTAILPINNKYQLSHCLSILIIYYSRHYELSTIIA